MERAIAGQGFASIWCAPPLRALDIRLTQGHGQPRIAPQVAVVMEILVAKCQPEEAPHEEIQQRVLDLFRVDLQGKGQNCQRQAQPAPREVWGREFRFPIRRREGN